MQIALVNSKKTEPFSKGKGSCPICGSEMIAKCGSRIMHHWAHFRSRNCDPWWENETPWHRNWKNNFPIDCREVSHRADNGEIHRADIKTPTGIVDDERISREKFYKNLIWIIDGSVF